MVRPHTAQVSSGLTRPSYQWSGALCRGGGTLPSACNDPLGELRGDGLIALELDRELGPAAADRGQVRGVVAHLRHRPLRSPLARPPFRFHPEWVAAARVEVADHLADDLLWTAHGEPDNRLEQDRLRRLPCPARGPPATQLVKP